MYHEQYGWNGEAIRSIYSVGFLGNLYFQMNPSDCSLYVLFWIPCFCFGRKIIKIVISGDIVIRKICCSFSVCWVFLWLKFLFGFVVFNLCSDFFCSVVDTNWYITLLDPQEKNLIYVFFCQIKFYILPQINFLKKKKIVILFFSIFCLLF